MLIERFEGQHLERLLALKRAVEAGERLGDYHSTYLARVLRETRLSKRFVDRHPEYQGLYARAVRLYGDITRRALENEMKAVQAPSSAGGP
jgi:hypothetical protein